MEAPPESLVTARLAKVSELLMGSLPAIVSKQFEQLDDGDPYEDCTLNANVRRKLKTLLRMVEADAECEEDAEHAEDAETVVNISLSNIGLEAIFNGVQFHVHMGKSLPPARTKRRRRFYSQQTDPTQLRLHVDSLPDPPSIVGHASYLWRFDALTRLLTIDLVCPMWVSGDVTEAWRHSVFAAKVERPRTIIVEEQDGDLPIYREEDEQTAYFEGSEADDQDDISALRHPDQDEPERGSEGENA